jgi:L-alanine-DL-glutamate epimerase-like enolase superfamily enzyme
VTQREDYEAYLERSAELDRRIAAGESIMDIMRAEQLERGKALIARALELDAQDGAEWE